MSFWKDKVRWQTIEIAQQYDDASWWSQLAGKLIFEHVQMEGVQQVIDIGCGTGYPLINLAEKLGPSCEAYGLDIWDEALMIIERKKTARGLSNVNVIRADASKIPLPDESMDLVVSNLGVNNFSNRDSVVLEIARILRPGGKFVLATNLVGTFEEFYVELEKILKAHHSAGLDAFEEHVASRATEDEILSLGIRSGLKVRRTVKQTEKVRYASGSAFLNDYFIRMAFLPSWLSFFPHSTHEVVMPELERTLNDLAVNQGGLTLSIPVMFVEYQK